MQFSFGPNQNAPDAAEAQRHFDQMRQSIAREADIFSAEDFDRVVGNPIKGVSMKHAADKEQGERESG